MPHSDAGLAAFTAKDVARAFGGEANGHEALIPGPGHSAKDRSLCVRLDDAAPGGFVVFSFAGDDPLACRDYVRAGLGLGSWTPEKASRALSVVRPPRPAKDDGPRIKSALRLWAECVPPRATLVEDYLWSRNLFLPPAVERGGHLRFHPDCPMKGEDEVARRLPCMVALMTDALSGEPRAIHRTALRANGRGKAEIVGLGNPKKMLGPAKGCVVRLCPDEDVKLRLGLAEGIENALAILCAGWAPVWAPASAAILAVFPVLDGIETLRIFADGKDRDRAGEKAACLCASRWGLAGCDTKVLLPAGGDWNTTLDDGGGDD